MKIVSRLAAIVGVLALLVGVGLLVYGTLQAWQQYLAISADRSKSFVNPIPMSLLGTLVVAVGAFLFGLGLNLRPTPAQPRPVDRADTPRPNARG